MSLEDIVQVTISAQTSTPTRPGFGTPLISAGKVPAGWGANKVRTFAKLAELTDAGFLVTDPAYKAASAMKAQSPCPPKFKIGKRAAAPSQSVHLKCLSATTGEVYALTVAGHPLTYTVPGASTTTTVATAIAALIDALTEAVATSSTDTITVTPATAGLYVDFEAYSKNLTIQDVTADAGIAADLAAFNAEDSDWYGLVLDCPATLEIEAAAAWVESNKKLFTPNSADTNTLDSVSTTDVAYVLKQNTYKRTGFLYCAKYLSYAGAAWMAEEFPFDPGGRTWAYKSLPGVPVDNLTAGQRAALDGKNANYYTPIAGLNVTQYGKTAAGDYLDNQRFIDWLESEMKIRVFAALANNPKIPYTDKGVSTILGIVRGTLRAGVRAGGLADDENLFATAPKVADVDPVSRGGRLLPDVNFGGRLAGAIHTMKINGTLTI